MSADLTTRYLGLELAHPVVPSASPLTGDIEHIHALVDAGAPALVLPSLFEEQIEHDEMALHYSLEMGADGFGEAPGGFFPQLDDYNTGPEDYLDLIRRAKEEVHVPVIASLNGVSTGGWTLYAQILADQGVDALELNIYRIAADITMSGEEVEKSYLELVETVKKSVNLPLAVKVGPYFSSLGFMAQRLHDAGADGLVMFNRFYQPDIDLDTLGVNPDIVLSSPVALRLVLQVDGDPPWAGGHRPGCNIRCAHFRRCSQRSSVWCRRRDDGFCVAASRSRPPHGGSGRSRKLADRT